MSKEIKVLMFVTAMDLVMVFGGIIVRDFLIIILGLLLVNISLLAIRCQILSKRLDVHYEFIKKFGKENIKKIAELERKISK